MDRLLQILFGTFLFTLPFSVRFLAYEENAYRFGHFNPWASEFIYLPEALLMATFLLWLYIRKQESGNRKQRTTIFRFLFPVFGLLILNALIVTFLRGDGVLGLFWLLRTIEILMLYCLLTSHILPTPKIIQFLLGGAAFQLILAAFQWKLNHSVGLTWLGEPVIGPDVLNVAKLDLPAGKHIRSYGTFLHPNILGAYFVTLFFVALNFLNRRRKILWLLLSGLGVFLTQSLAAMVVGAVGLLIWILFLMFKKPAFRRGFSMAFFLLLILGNAWFFASSYKIQTTDASIQERLQQNIISREMIKAHPLGVGARNFTLAMENFSERKLKPWEFQPVHNAFFLALNETGIQGLVLLFILIGWFLYRSRAATNLVPLLTLLLLAPFDHFLWDSFAGLMLVALAVGFLSLHNEMR